MCVHVGHQHSQILSILTRFMDYYSPFWGPEAISIVVEPKDALTCRSSTLAVLADSGPFCGILLTLLGPEGISTIDEPLVRLCVGHQHSRFLSILTRFVDYYTSFWGPKVISMLVEQQVALTCRSSTLTVLADPGPFHGLLLTVLGSWSDFHD